MDRQPRPQWPPLERIEIRLPASGIAVAILLGVVANGGCSWLGEGKLAQYQSENDRLIGDFRAERMRSSVLDERNEALSDRVAHLENRLAAVSSSLRDETLDEGSPPKTRSAALPPEANESPRPKPVGPLQPWRGRP